jgi:uncharacterized membrane protein
MLPDRSAKCVGAAHALYGRILDKIEAQDYDVFTSRASVSTTEKASWSPTALDHHPDPVLVNKARTGRILFTSCGGGGGWGRHGRRDDRDAAAAAGRPGAAGAVDRGRGRIVRHHHRERRAALGRTARGCRGGVTAVGTTAVERVGTETGLPFGRYAYTSALQPQVAHVPAIVPLAWFAMGLPAREAAHAALGEHSTPARRIALGSVALTAWDLFLDPQMVGEGYWVWARRGIYRGHPAGNFVGWFVTGLGVMALLEALLPPAEYVDGSADADGALVGEYAFMGVMETIGFARYFRDPAVAVVGGLGMLPIAAAAVAGRLRG